MPRRSLSRMAAPDTRDQSRQERRARHDARQVDPLTIAVVVASDRAEPVKRRHPESARCVRVARTTGRRFVDHEAELGRDRLRRAEDRDRARRALHGPDLLEEVDGRRHAIDLAGAADPLDLGLCGDERASVVARTSTSSDARSATTFDREPARTTPTFTVTPSPSPFM